MLPERPSDLPAATREVLDAAALVLSAIDELPPDATGALRFGASGMILVQQGHVCWAVAPHMEQRLTQLLRLQRSPPLDHRHVEQVIGTLRQQGVPLGEGLLSSGVVSEEGLRAALFTHTIEAITHIAVADEPCESFGRHVGAGYDPRFVFSTAELLAALGAHRNRALATAVGRHLRGMLVEETRGLAFSCDDAGPALCAVQGRPAVRVSEVLDLRGWASGVFDVASAFDRGVRIAMGGTAAADAVLSWRTGEAIYVALCANRATCALLMSRLDRHFEQTEVRP